MKLISMKIPEGMLELWREAAEQRGSTLSQLIREAVNKDIAPKGKPAQDELE